MLNWGALIGDKAEAETVKSGEIPHLITPVSDKVGNEEPSNGAASKAESPLSPQSPLKKQGGRLETEHETRAGGGAAVNFSEEKTYPVSPLAVCLLLACCDRIKADEPETVEALMMLKLSTPAEQVRGWATLCIDNGIDPNRVHTSTLSPGEGVECRGCQHLGAGWVQRPGVRRMFRFTCNKHHAMLELGFAGERVLIAPPECSDYAGRYGSLSFNPTA